MLKAPTVKTRASDSYIFFRDPDLNLDQPADLIGFFLKRIKKSMCGNNFLQA